MEKSNKKRVCLRLFEVEYHLKFKHMRINLIIVSILLALLHTSCNKEQGNAPTNKRMIIWELVDSSQTASSNILQAPSDIVKIISKDSLFANNLNLGEPKVKDMKNIAYITNNSTSCYPLGKNNVTWIIMDQTGNIELCSQRVEIQHNR